MKLVPNIAALILLISANNLVYASNEKNLINPEDEDRTFTSSHHVVTPKLEIIFTEMKLENSKQVFIKAQISYCDDKFVNAVYEILRTHQNIVDIIFKDCQFSDKTIKCIENVMETHASCSSINFVHNQLP